MTTLCDPLSHQMDIDSYDIPEWEGLCIKCDADLTYRWGYDQDQVDKSNIYFNSYTGKKYHNYDIGTMSDYRINSVFAVLSDVDNDRELLKGVFIIPYTSVTIIAFKDGVETTNTEIFNPTYDQLKSPSNKYGDHTAAAFTQKVIEQMVDPYAQPNQEQFNKAWQKVVTNDSWLKKTYSGSWNAINIRQVADKFRPRKV